MLNYKNSLGRIYEIVSALDYLEPEKVIFETIDVISHVVESNDVAIYTCNKDNSYCRLIAASSKQAKTLGKSMDLKRLKEIYMCLQKQTIYMNRNMDPLYPIMAGGIYNSNTLSAVVFIWSLELENTNLYQANLFSIVCKLIERSMNRAYTYMEMIHETSYKDGSKILFRSAFKKIVSLYDYGKSKKLVDYTLLRIVDYDMDPMEAYEKITSSVRETDYIGEGKDGNLFILVTNTNKSEARAVIERFNQNKILVDIV